LSTTTATSRSRVWHRNWEFWASISIVVVAIVLSVSTALGWLAIRFRIGPYFVTHWLSWIGTLFIAVYTPLYYGVKRRRPHVLKRLITVHMIGNLLSFTFISMHFTQQITRPSRFYPDLGTGIALYLIMLVLVSTGFLHRFQLIPSARPHWNRYLHVSTTTAFYTVIVIHILQGIGII
jgi:hypothetical protein